MLPTDPATLAWPGQVISLTDSQRLRDGYQTRPAYGGCRVLVHPPTALMRSYGLGTARYAWLIRHGRVGAPGADWRGARVKAYCGRRDCVRHLEQTGYSPLVAKWVLTCG